MKRSQAPDLLWLYYISSATFIALCIISWSLDNRIRNLERTQAEPPQPQALSVNLDLTKPALSACLNAFLRYSQGGPIEDYECRVDGSKVHLYGPAWDEYSQHPQGSPPKKHLGAVQMATQGAK